MRWRKSGVDDLVKKEEELPLGGSSSCRPFVPRIIRGAAGSALGELEALAGAWTTGFLALAHAGITGEESASLKGGAVLFVEIIEGTGDGEAEGSSLSLKATTGGLGLDVVILGNIHGLKWLENSVLHRGRREILVEILPVDADLSAAGGELDAGDGCLAATGGGVGCCGHDIKDPVLLGGLGILAAVGMLGTGIDLELSVNGAA